MSDGSRPTAGDRRTAWALVMTQAVLIAGVVLIPRRAAWQGLVWLEWVAWAAIAGGVILGLWGAVHLGSGLTPLPLPNGAVDLVTRGPYRWVRHPIYSAVILGVGGVALKSRTTAALILAAGLALFLAMKARWEERHLRAAFPGYEDYARVTGRFLPGVGSTD